MAKPIAATDLPPPWGGAGNYGATVYSQFLPWGAPNPPFPGATPWSGQPRLDAAGIVSFANNGFEPQLPTPASPYNEYMRRLQVYTQWVEDGTFAADATAHVVETDAAGVVFAVLVEATDGVQGAGATPIDLPQGATVPTGKSVAITDGATVSFAGTGKVAGVNTTIVDLGLIDFQSGAAAPTARQMTIDTNGLLKFHDGSGIVTVHATPNGWVYATGDQEAATALAVTQIVATTSGAIVGAGLGNVRVRVEGQAQVNALGQLLNISVQEDQTANPAFTDVGAVQAITATKTTLTATDWQPFVHERRFLAGTSTATLYRCRVAATGGTTVQLKEVRVTVVNDIA